MTVFLPSIFVAVMLSVALAFWFSRFFRHYWTAICAAAALPSGGIIALGLFAAGPYVIGAVLIVAVVALPFSLIAATVICAIRMHRRL